MENQKYKFLALKLVHYLPIKEKYKKFIDKDSLMLKIYSLTQNFVEEYTKANIDDCLEVYAEYLEDISELLTFDNALKDETLNSKLLEAISTFLIDNDLEK